MTMVEKSSTQEVFSIQDFVAELDKLPALLFRDVERVYKFICAHPVDPNTLAPYLMWDKQHYTRNLISKTSDYELMAICWEAGQSSSIHNHDEQNCWMAVPIGRLLVQNYRVLSQEIEKGLSALEITDTLEINPVGPVAVDPDCPVHRVHNPVEFNRRAVSLHLYSLPFETCIVYSHERGTCGVTNLRYTTEYGRSGSNSCLAERSPQRSPDQI